MSALSSRGLAAELERQDYLVNQYLQSKNLNKEMADQSSLYKN